MLKLVNNKHVLFLSVSHLYHSVDNKTLVTDVDLESFQYKPEFILTPLFNHLENFYTKYLKLTNKGLVHTHSEDIFINEYITSFLAAATDYLKHRLPNEDFCSFIFKKCTDKQYSEFLEQYLAKGNTMYSLNIQLFEYSFKIFD